MKLVDWLHYLSLSRREQFVILACAGVLLLGAVTYQARHRSGDASGRGAAAPGVSSQPQH